MRKKGNKKTGLLAVLLILVLLISVGYAALTTTLSINGTATLKKQSWSVYFNNVQVKDGSVSGAKVTTAPTVPNGSKTTTTLSWNVSMDTPGEYYEFNVDVVNEGSIDAMIQTATADIVTSALTADQQKYLDYTIKYVNGATIERYDKLAAGETKTITVKLLFKNDESVNPSDLPSTNQTGISLSYSTNYVQADNNAVGKQVEKQIFPYVLTDLPESSISSTLPWTNEYSPFTYRNTDFFAGKTISKIGLPVKKVQAIDDNQTFTVYIVNKEDVESHRAITIVDTIVLKPKIEDLGNNANAVNKWIYFDINKTLTDSQTFAFGNYTDTVILGCCATNTQA